MFKSFLKKLIGVQRPFISLYNSLPLSASVLDVGCFNYVQYKIAHDLERIERVEQAHRERGRRTKPRACGQVRKDVDV